ncbi:MAG: aminomethyl-transferring glycine dehydrogenase subunit GcvPB [Dehalococcoidia bacterium]|nr:aminomethyl-transferring glycine dehydrogenase subunit GcvPB [Dehalococcoidia bacterium]
MDRRTLMERSVTGRVGANLPALDVPPQPALDAALLRDELRMPEVTEPQVVRYFTLLSHLNFSIDTNFYPLGSCTMKYNPKVNDEMAFLPGFAGLHPRQPPETVQGALKLLHTLQGYLAEITGTKGVGLAPLAGAQGEFCGMLMIRALLLDRGETQRTTVAIPDSAHGTNPASAAMAGFQVVTIPSDSRGNMDMEALKAVADSGLAGLMITQPNTLGLFNTNILELCDTVHRAGGLVYADGANMNALLGRAKPADLGFDVVHLNLHKTFTTPHGGGGPGAGPVCASEELTPYLPAPVVERSDSDGRETFSLAEPPKSIGRVSGFHGNFGVLVRAYTYIRSMGNTGLTEVSGNAVLNANYLLQGLRDTYHVPYDRRCMHEVVVSARDQKARGVRGLDIAKRLLDYGIHAPTMYFPLIVDETLMIEPTETESRETLDAFIEAMRAIDREVTEDPDLVTGAPHTTPVSRLDEVRAARQPDLRG